MWPHGLLLQAAPPCHRPPRSPRGQFGKCPRVLLTTPLRATRHAYTLTVWNTTGHLQLPQQKANANLLTPRPQPYFSITSAPSALLAWDLNFTPSVSERRPDEHAFPKPGSRGF